MFLFFTSFSNMESVKATVVCEFESKEKAILTFEDGTKVEFNRFNRMDDMLCAVYYKIIRNDDHNWPGILVSGCVHDLFGSIYGYVKNLNKIENVDWDSLEVVFKLPLNRPAQMTLSNEGLRGMKITIDSVDIQSQMIVFDREFDEQSRKSRKSI